MNIKYPLYETIIRIIVLLAVISCALLILSPFFNIILWTIIIAVALGPTHRFIAKKLGNKLKLASIITVGGILLIVIIPIILLGNSLVSEVNHAKASYDNGSLHIPAANHAVKQIPIIGDKIYNIWTMAITDQSKFIAKYQTELTSVGSTLLNYGNSIIQGFAEILIALVLAGLLLSIEKTEEAIRLFFMKLAGDKGDDIVNLILKTVSTVAKGIIGEGLVLGILHGIVFIIADVPYAAVWALLVFIFAIMQLPIFAVTIPVCVYFFFVYDNVPAIIWSIVVVLTTMTDNVLTPIMLGKGSPIPMAVMFIGVLGGFSLFGFIGLFTGPVVFAIAYNLLLSWMYPKHVEVITDSNSKI